MRIAKKLTPIRLLGGPGPAAVSLDAVLQYKRTMPPTKVTKMTNVARLAKTLNSTKSLIARASIPRATGERAVSTSMVRPATGSLLREAEHHAAIMKWS
jgi:hypothetical protein